MVKQVLSIKLEREEIARLKEVASMNDMSVSRLLVDGLKGLQNYEQLVQKNNDMADQIQRLQQETGRRVIRGKRVSFTLPVDTHKKLSVEAASKGKPLSHLLRDRVLGVQTTKTVLPALEQ